MSGGLVPGPSRGECSQRVTIRRRQLLGPEVSDDLLGTRLGVIVKVVRNERGAFRGENLHRDRSLSGVPIEPPLIRRLPWPTHGKNFQISRRFAFDLGRRSRREWG